MKCLIADDNELALLTLKTLLSQIPEISIEAVCSNAIQAFDFLQNNTVDLAILDVEMPGMTGVELIQSLTNKPATILSTSNPKYATDAFDLDVADYIIKPVSLPRLLKSIEKAKMFLKQEKKTGQSNFPDILFIKEKGVLKKINLQDVSYVEAMGDYVKIHCTDKWYTANTTIKEIEEKYSQLFIRVHRSYLACLQKIEAIEDGQINIGKARIPLADSYRKKVIEKLNLI
jgi:two-component system, LytTR family, response regulator